MTAVVGTLLAAYLLGSFVPALWIARLRGVELRDHGSRSGGATNAGRVLGAPAFVAVLVLDAGKGFVAAWGAAVSGLQPEGWPGQALPVAAAVAAVLGQVFPVWHRWRGGKGVASAAGALAALAPWALLFVVPLFLVAFAITRVVGLASVVSALALPVLLAAVWLSGWRPVTSAVLGFGVAVSLLLLATHRDNLRRARDDVR